MIPQNTIASITEAARIEEVVGDFVTLKKRGVNFIACCPFHNEKTPSFTVSPTKNIYKCFGCGEAGSSINFVMEHENMTYPDALRYLAKKYNIHIEEIDDDKGREERQARDSLFIINHFAQEHFQHNLQHTDEGKSVALSYFRSRGFTDTTIEKFQLGYSIEDWDTFTNAAKEKGYRLELLKKLGLVGEKNGRYYPFFRGRVMFPIHGLSGKVVAFAGRTLKKDKKSPKYVNSPETEIYNKSKVLYGMFLARQAVRKQDDCILVEGYTDVISLHQAGIENVVASSGTSLTPDQVRLIKRYTPNITILYDGDAAGIKAALRGVDIILTEGMNVKVVILPEGEDPDSFVQAKGKTEFLNYVKEIQKDFIFFKADLLLKEAGDDPIKKSAVIQDLIKTLAKIPDPIKRALYVRECANLLDISERLIITQTNKIKYNQIQKKQNQQSLKEAQEAHLPASTQDLAEIERIANKKVVKQETTGLALCERDLVRLLLEFGEEFYDIDYYVAVYIIQQTLDLPPTNPTYNKMVQLYREHLEEGKTLSKDFFLEYQDPKINKAAIDLLSSPYELSENWKIRHEIFVTEIVKNFKPEVENLVNRYKLRWVLKMKDENQEKIKEAQKANDIDTSLALLKNQMQYEEWIKQLTTKLKGVIIR